ncbi:hypothetical protein ACFRJ1_16605 [Streptomyces sp. NPDC056773]|uniref:hypothetical protein n=1 Tax=unclassified Streptomyces TaxID=2593676 RepID=UPI00368E3B9E
MAPNVPVEVAQRAADAAGGSLGALIARAAQGIGQKCPWELVTVAVPTAEARAATAWIVADAIMRDRTETDTVAYNLWRAATLAEQKLDGGDRLLVLAYAGPVFEAAGRGNLAYQGHYGYIGEWLWYLLALEEPHQDGRSIEIIPSPGHTSTDSGGDGIVIHRVSGTTTTFVFRLWEMKKFTGADNKVTPTISKAFKQLSNKGAEYLGAMAWADKHLAPETRVFVSTLVSQWLKAEPTSHAGVSVAINAAATPARAFNTAHNHLPTHRHPGALQGRIVAIDDFESFANDVREYVWTAL